MAGQLTVAIDGPVATVVIDNPAKRNAMTADMWRALPRLLASLEADPLVRVVVLTGAGETFCAGADIANLAAIGTETAGANLAVAAEEALAAFAKPTIAAIRGDCIGGGCQLALACDIRLAAPGTRFGITPAKLGVIYPMTSIRRLVRVAGVGAAQWLLLSAELVDAQRAHHLSLVHEVVAGLGERTATVAGVLASRSLLSQVAMKEMIADGDLEPARVEHWMSQVRESGEAAEGAAAFLARRPPEFPWRPR
ncbi:MAG TPA: enoyl-CoA hydratase [Micromonosporaceae bacterium]|nr:enoyl-CoA hydratase [Micromonosporaceae bacterium]HCU51247.1 enoyl-CoA hydratase [Micromonosporaceae bacterium]